VRKYSVRIAGHPTSISLEPEFWAAFGRTAERRGTSVAALITEIDEKRTGGLSSAIRLFVLADLEGR
jgi:predicted DNA-binding ribbon-helix-helix protein